MVRHLQALFGSGSVARLSCLLRSLNSSIQLLTTATISRLCTSSVAWLAVAACFGSLVSFRFTILTREFMTPPWIRSQLSKQFATCIDTSMRRSGVRAKAVRLLLRMWKARDCRMGVCRTAEIHGISAPSVGGVRARKIWPDKITWPLKVTSPLLGYWWGWTTPAAVA